SAETNDCSTAWQELKDRELTARGVVVDNNSWGYVLGWNGPVNGFWVWEDTEEFFGAYDYEFTAPVDQIARDRDILFVYSSGNEGDGVNLPSWGEHYHVNNFLEPVTSRLFCYSKNGSGTDCPAPCGTGACETVQHHTVLPYDTISVSAAAKNAIAVGAVDTAKNVMALSSRGPAKDGRVKPDVVARGSFVLSTLPTNSYGTRNGTSMAAPVVTGIAALLTEQWRRTFSATPKPAHLKAVILAGAEDLGDPGPDYTFGFGLVNAQASADLIVADGGASKHIRTGSVAQGQQIELPIVVTNPQDVRVVLQWTDPPVFLPPNQVHTAKALVNDLDLKVVGPAGETHLPYVLDKVNYTAPAARGVNTIDNSEMVEIANAAPGVYRIQVSGTNVLQGPQEAVVVSNARGPNPCVDPQEGAAVYGDLVPNQTISGGLCAAGDVDSYKFTVTESGAISVDVTAGDTPLRVTLSSAQVNATLDVPAHAMRTLTTAAVTAPLAVSLQIEGATALGVEPSYSFTPKFGQFSGPRRRSVRK
ncbi:MAG TPA: S8 family serine peptidase, partial [Thermoanaerobaculia bacterium]|nr:S8 family serine peptidase [Thermoanaerobaculia bacterium]